MATYPASFAHGLMFHRFHRQGEPAAGQGSISDAAFEAMLRAIGSERILAPQEWMSRANAGLLQPADLCITFDDGLKNQVEVALPVLERLGLKAFWFIYSAALRGSYDRNEIANLLATRYFASFNAYVQQFEALTTVSPKAFESADWHYYAQGLKARFPFYSASDVRYRYMRNHLLSLTEFETAVDRLLALLGLDLHAVAGQLWMTADQVGALHTSGHVIGMHSYSHPFSLSALSARDQRAEYQANFDDLTQITGQPPRSMSHPLNSYSPATLEILANLGIECGFCSNMQPPGGHASVNPSPLEFAREDSTTLLALTASSG